MMEEDILKYSPTVMFRGTPCIIIYAEAGTLSIVNLEHLIWISNVGTCKFEDAVLKGPFHFISACND